MKIDYVSQDETGKAALTASATGDEAPLLVPGLLFDAAPGSVDAGHIAVAATLLFSRFADSTISFPLPIDASLAVAIARVTGLRVVSDLNEDPESGDAVEEEAPIRATRLVVDIGTEIAPATPQVDETRLLLVPGERFQGALWGVKEYVIASNGWYISSLVDRVSVLAAAGLLYSKDLPVKEISALGPDSDAAARAATELCGELGITFN